MLLAYLKKKNRLQACLNVAINLVLLTVPCFQVIIKM